MRNSDKKKQKSRIYQDNDLITTISTVSPTKTTHSNMYTTLNPNLTSPTNTNKAPHNTLFISLDNPPSTGQSLHYIRKLKPLPGRSDSVQLAEISSSRERIVLKKLSKNDSLYPPSSSHSVERDIHLCSNHPNVIKTLSSFETQNSVYLMMEYASCGDLFEAISHPDHNEFKASKYVRDIVAGLQYIHDSGIIHRDIKTENVVVDGKGTCKIIDFGFAARMPSENRNQSSVLLNDHYIAGTIDYLSPEIIRQLPYNQSIDIWAIGVLTYILLCRHVPFVPRSNRIESISMRRSIITKAILANDIHSGPTFAASSPEAKDFILRILNRRPEKRLSLTEMLIHPFLNLPDPENLRLAHIITMRHHRRYDQLQQRNKRFEQSCIEKNEISSYCNDQIQNMAIPSDSDTTSDFQAQSSSYSTSTGESNSTNGNSRSSGDDTATESAKSSSEDEIFKTKDHELGEIDDIEKLKVQSNLGLIPGTVSVQAHTDSISSTALLKNLNDNELIKSNRVYNRKESLMLESIEEEETNIEKLKSDFKNENVQEKVYKTKTQILDSKNLVKLQKKLDSFSLSNSSNEETFQKPVDKFKWKSLQKLKSESENQSLSACKKNDFVKCNTAGRKPSVKAKYRKKSISKTMKNKKQQK